MTQWFGTQYLLVDRFCHESPSVCRNEGWGVSKETEGVQGMEGRQG